MEPCQWHEQSWAHVVKLYTEIRITRKRNRRNSLVKMATASFQATCTPRYCVHCHTHSHHRRCLIVAYGRLYLWVPYFNSGKKAISLINELGESKSGCIVARVLQKVHIKMCLLARAHVWRVLFSYTSELCVHVVHTSQNLLVKMATASFQATCTPRYCVHCHTHSHHRKCLSHNYGVLYLWAPYVNNVRKTI